MRCPQCDHENPTTASSCRERGARLERPAPDSAPRIHAGDTFYPQWRASLISRPPPPQTCVPPHLAEEILTARGVLEGERKHVTALFCDVANSTALAERRRLLDEAAGRALETLHADRLEEHHERLARCETKPGKVAKARDYLARAPEILERLRTLVEPDKVRALAGLPTS